MGGEIVPRRARPSQKKGLAWIFFQWLGGESWKNKDVVQAGEPSGRACNPSHTFELYPMDKHEDIKRFQ